MEKNKLKHIGWFSEMDLSAADSGSIKEYISDHVSYDKHEIISYLNSQKRIASCPKAAIDCLTGEKISSSFYVFTDGEYDWCDFLVYHIEKYNIKLPEDFIKHIKA